jgi:hypothetical protein
MRALADGLRRGPSHEFLRSAVPVGDHLVHVADEDRVVGEIEEACLARADCNFLLKLVECALEVALDDPTSRGEPTDDQREDDERADVG